MAPSVIVPSTSVVVVDSTAIAGPIVVQLNSLKTLGTLLTVKDIGGDISYTNPLILSTVHGVSFRDGSSSITLTVPFDCVTVQPISQTQYDVLNTAAFPTILASASSDSISIQHFDTTTFEPSTVVITNVESVSSFVAYGSTTFSGPLYVKDTLIVQTPVTQIENVQTTKTSTSVLSVSEGTIQSIQANTLNTNVFSYGSSNLEIVAKLKVLGKTQVSSLTTKTNVSVLSVDSLSTVTVSTNTTTATHLDINNLLQPFTTNTTTCIQTGNVSEIFVNALGTLSSLDTNNVSILSILTAQDASFSSISTGTFQTTTLVSKLLSTQNTLTSSIAVIDTLTHLQPPLWTGNGILYYGQTEVLVDGQGFKSVPSTVDGLGQLGYLSTYKLDISTLSTKVALTNYVSVNTLQANIFSRSSLSAKNVQVNTLSTNSLTVPFATVNNTAVSSFTFETISSVNGSAIMISSGILNTSSVVVGTAKTNYFSTNSIRTNVAIISLTVDETLTGNNAYISSLQTSTLNTNNLTTNQLTAHERAFIKNGTAPKMFVKILEDLTTNVPTIATSSLVTNNVSYSYTNNDILYLSNASLFVNSNQVVSQSQYNNQVQSTLVGLGSLGYVSSLNYPYSSFTTGALLTSVLGSSNARFEVLETTQPLVVRRTLIENVETGNTRTLRVLTSSLYSDSTLTSSVRGSNTNTLELSSLSGRTRSLRGNTYIASTIVTSTVVLDGEINTNVLDSKTFTTVDTLNIFANFNSPNVSTNITLASNITTNTLQTSQVNASTFSVNNLTSKNITTKSVFSQLYTTVRGFFMKASNTSLQTTTLSSKPINTDRIYTTNVYTSSFTFQEFQSDQGEDINVALSSNNFLTFNGQQIYTQSRYNTLFTSTSVGLGSSHYLSTLTTSDFTSSFSDKGTFVQLNVANTSSGNITATRLVTLSLSTNTILARDIQASIQVTSDVSLLNVNASNLTTSSINSELILLSTLTVNSNTTVNGSIASLQAILQNVTQLSTATSRISDVSSFTTQSISSGSVTTNQARLQSLETATAKLSTANITLLDTLYSATSSITTKTVSITTTTQTNVFRTYNYENISGTFSTPFISCISLALENVQTSSVRALITSSIYSEASSIRTSTITFNNQTLGASNSFYILNNTQVNYPSTLNKIVTDATFAVANLYLSSIQGPSLFSQQMTVNTMNVMQIQGERLDSIDTKGFSISCGSAIVSSIRTANVLTQTLNADTLTNISSIIRNITTDSFEYNRQLNLSNVNALTVSTATFSTNTLSIQDLKTSTFSAVFVSSGSLYTEFSEFNTLIGNRLTTDNLINNNQIQTLQINTSSIESAILTTSSISTSFINTNSSQLRNVRVNTLTANNLDVNGTNITNTSATFLSSGTLQVPSIQTNSGINTTTTATNTLFSSLNATFTNTSFLSTQSILASDTYTNRLTVVNGLNTSSVVCVLLSTPFTSVSSANINTNISTNVLSNVTLQSRLLTLPQTNVQQVTTQTGTSALTVTSTLSSYYIETSRLLMPTTSTVSIDSSSAIARNILAYTLTSYNTVTRGLTQAEVTSALSLQTRSTVIRTLENVSLNTSFIYTSSSIISESLDASSIQNNNTFVSTFFSQQTNNNSSLAIYIESDTTNIVSVNTNSITIGTVLGQSIVFPTISTMSISSGITNVSRYTTNTVIPSNLLYVNTAYGDSINVLDFQPQTFNTTNLAVPQVNGVFLSTATISSDSQKIESATTKNYNLTNGLINALQTDSLQIQTFTTSTFNTQTLSSVNTNITTLNVNQILNTSSVSSLTADTSYSFGSSLNIQNIVSPSINTSSFRTNTLNTSSISSGISLLGTYSTNTQILDNLTVNNTFGNTITIVNLQNVLISSSRNVVSPSISSGSIVTNIANIGLTATSSIQQSSIVFNGTDILTVANSSPLVNNQDLGATTFVSAIVTSTAVAISKTVTAMSANIRFQTQTNTLSLTNSSNISLLANNAPLYFGKNITVGSNLEAQLFHFNTQRASTFSSVQITATSSNLILNSTLTLTNKTYFAGINTVTPKFDLDVSGSVKAVIAYIPKVYASSISYATSNTFDIVTQGQYVLATSSLLTIQTSTLINAPFIFSTNIYTSTNGGRQAFYADKLLIQSGSPQFYNNNGYQINGYSTLLVLNSTIYIDGKTNRVAINSPVFSTVSLFVNGAVAKTAGSFDIQHPDPQKPDYRLRHSFIESPTRGDTLYSWTFSTLNNNNTFTYNLPDYFNHLNTNPQCWVTPIEHFGNGRANVNLETNTLLLETTEDGLYTVLCVATRKDKDAHFFDDLGGVEYNN